MVIPASIKNHDDLISELCSHVREVEAQAQAGDAEAQELMAGFFHGHWEWFRRFWKRPNLSLDAQIDALDSLIARSVARLAGLQEQRGALAREIHAAKHAGLRREMLAGIALANARDEAAKHAAQMARYEEQQRQQLADAQAKADAEKRLALSVQERERLDAANAVRRSRELAGIIVD